MPQGLRPPQPRGPRRGSVGIRRDRRVVWARAVYVRAWLSPRMGRDKGFTSLVDSLQRARIAVIIDPGPCAVGVHAMERIEVCQALCIAYAREKPENPHLKMIHL